MASAAAGRSDLGLRLVVGVVLIAIALACVWRGGLAFDLLVTAGALLVFAEWAVMHRTGRTWRLFSLALLTATCLIASAGWAGWALLLLVGVAALLTLLHRARIVALRYSRWTGSGLLYAGLPALALIWLRAQTDGFALVVWLLAVVWATDSLAYFAGRSIGGPKLAPKLSPSKTWAGLAGGMTGAAATAALLAPPLHLAIPWPALAGALLALVAQAGDLFESWLKRLVKVKDSGTLLPGHGGIMDRVDGLIPVACLVAAVAAAR